MPKMANIWNVWSEKIVLLHLDFKMFEMTKIGFSIWEILMLLSFACSWPISIIKALRTKVVVGKSPVFMIIIIFGYVMGVVHKILYNPDWVTFLYVFNMLLVAFDLFLYFLYIKKNKKIIEFNNK